MYIAILLALQYQALLEYEH